MEQAKEPTKRGALTAEEAERRVFERGHHPLEPYPGSASTPWRVACNRCGREKVFTLRKWKVLGCRFCAKRLSTAQLAQILEGSSLELVGEPQSSRKALVKCTTCSETFHADLNSFKSKGRALCPFCNRSRLSFSQISKRIEDAGLILVGEPPKKASDRFQAKCGQCGREGTKLFSNLAKGYSGCRYCAPNSSVNPEEARQLFLARGLKPLVKFPGSHGGWKSQCLQCGKVVSPHYYSVAKGRGCKYCSGKAVDHADAVSLMKAQGYEPLVAYPGALQAWKSRCTACDRVSAPTYASVASKGSRCKFCNPAGINLLEPATFYLIAHSEFRAMKIGISGDGKSRLSDHERRGWHILATLKIENGEKALKLEQSMKRWLRQEKKLPQYLGKEEMPQRGETETFASDELDAEEIWTKVLEIVANQ